MIVFLDFDGPVLDVRAKYHAAFRQVLRDAGMPEPPEETIWGLRREGAGAEALLAAAGARERVDPERYRRRFAAIIEEDALLDLDVLQPGATEAIRALRVCSERLLLLTLRRRRAGVERQLSRFGLAPLVDEVLVAEGNSGGPEVKRDLVHASSSPGAGRRDVLVGDTESDVVAARLLGVRAVAVTCGLRSRARLAAAEPDAIVENLPAAARLLGGGGAVPGRAPNGIGGVDEVRS